MAGEEWKRKVPVSMGEFDPTPDEWEGQIAEATKPLGKKVMCGGREFAVSNALIGLAATSDAFNKICALAEGWGDETQAVPVPKAVTDFAIDILFKYAEAAWDVHAVIIQLPRITPLTNGTIDMDWRGDTHNLLINVHVFNGKVRAEYVSEAHESTDISHGFIYPDQPANELLSYALSIV